MTAILPVEIGRDFFVDMCFFEIEDFLSEPIFTLDFVKYSGGILRLDP
jgi:hypothetical protein